ncbi:hypothetical protein QDQ79_21190 [Enterobacter hormaechei]|uniref:hypothetical protein n=1 Tax=Enterobacter hormaechei TaxID=158836 RepID=UPI003354483B
MLTKTSSASFGSFFDVVDFAQNVHAANAEASFKLFRIAVDGGCNFIAEMRKARVRADKLIQLAGFFFFDLAIGGRYQKTTADNSFHKIAIFHFLKFNFCRCYFFSKQFIKHAIYPF